MVAAPVLFRRVGPGDEPVVEDRRQDAADDRADYVDQGDVPVVPGHDDRAEGARRVNRRPSRGPADKDGRGERESDGYRRHPRGRPVVGGDRHDDENEDKGYEGLDQYGLQEPGARTRRRGGGGRLVAGLGPERDPGGDGGEDGPQKLCADVGRNEVPGEFPRYGQAQRYGGVEVGPRYVPERRHPGAEHEAQGPRRGGRGGWPGRERR